MFFDNIILFLNVLEQFAIRVTIFDLNIEDIIKYVNKTFFFNSPIFHYLFICNNFLTFFILSMRLISYDLHIGISD